MKIKQIFQKNKDERMFFVGNMEQKIIFCCEMDGQISDGMWENSGSSYEDWMYNWDQVKVSSGKVGHLNNVPRRKYYNFADKELLDIVGLRVIIKINLWKKFGNKILDALKSDHWEIPDSASNFKDYETRAAKGNDKYAVDRMTVCRKLGITYNDMVVAEKGPYTMSNLRKDCIALRKAGTTILNSAEPTSSSRLNVARNNYAQENLPVRPLTTGRKLGPKGEFAEKIGAGINLNGRSFCITGPLQKATRDEYITIIQNNGGTYFPHVKDGLTYLVTNDKNSGSSKNEAAKRLGIKRIDEKALVAMIHWG